MRRALVTLIALGAAGCSAVTSFDRAQAIEESAALCVDHVDNDEDGLTDCQDWKCLGQAACCNLPTVVIDDAFPAGATCACPTAAAPVCTLEDEACSPSRATWATWGTPAPRVCAGGLVSCKRQNCYDVGLLSKPTVAIEPGVKLRVWFEGEPEPRGRFTAALTFQQEPLALSDQECLPIAPVRPVAGVELVAREGGGSDFLLLFGEEIVDRVPRASGASDVTIAIGEGGHVQYVVDDKVVPARPEQVVPLAGQDVRVALYGRGVSTRLRRVRLSHGTKCEAQAAWSVAPGGEGPPAATLAASTLWQDLAVFRPSVAAAPSGDAVQLAYSGCSNAGSSSCLFNVGGAAITPLGGAPLQAAECSFITGSGGACIDGAVRLFGNASNHYDVGLAFVADPEATGVTSAPPALLALVSQPMLSGVGGEQIRVALAREAMRPVTKSWKWSVYPGPATLNRGAAGTWSAAEVCCASFNDRRDGAQHVWYSGRDAGGVWRIGHATLGRDGTFASDPNPVLDPELTGTIDRRGVSDPEVVWDAQRQLYRMWYVAHDSLDETSIGLAVSTDGLRWHKYPGNPVVRAAQVGLRRVANPTVLMGDDGMRMWVDGESAARPGLGIFELRNAGAPPK